jgi:hypothetical protein
MIDWKNVKINCNDLKDAPIDLDHKYGPTEEELFEILCYEFEIPNDDTNHLRNTSQQMGLSRNDYLNEDKNLKHLIRSTKKVCGEPFFYNMVFLNMLSDRVNDFDIYRFGGIGMSVIERNFRILVLIPGLESYKGNSYGSVLRTLPKSTFFKNMSKMKRIINIPKIQWNPKMAFDHLSTV